MNHPRRVVRHRLAIRWGAWLACLLTSSSLAWADDWRFEVSFAPEVRAESFTGRIFLFFAPAGKEPRLGPSWFSPPPFVALDVRDWQPESTLKLDLRTPGLICFPRSLAATNLANLQVQAVARFNPLERTIGLGAGNGYSAVHKLAADSSSQPLVLRIDALVGETKSPESRWSKLLEVPSPLLTRFHERPVSTRAMVALPASYYDQPERRYPVLVVVPGFGGTHRMGARSEPLAEENPGGVEFLHVYLDPSCPLGHHAFADSANNGPVGTALIQEFLTELDRQFRTVPVSTARFLNGHSSGGWSTLWLQVTYPEHFGGTWSTSPDPVDFRDFQRINLYAPGENMYRDARGERRPLARRGAEVKIWYHDFTDMEWTLGPGGQLHSFEAAFSPRGADGTPRLLWDRSTGLVDTEVARTWEAYDIRLILERNWPVLRPKLAGKLRVFMGDEDTFYLEGATRLLKETLSNLGSDAVVELMPGKDHMNLYTAEFTQRMRREMAETFLKFHPSAAAFLSDP